MKRGRRGRQSATKKRNKKKLQRKRKRKKEKKSPDKSRGRLAGASPREIRFANHPSQVVPPP